jgi:hypothetical protein
MSGTIEAVNRMAGAWADLAWAVSWQGALLVAAFALVALGMRHSSPGLRYGLWQLAAIKLLVMPLWGVAIALPAPPRRDPGERPGARPAAQADGTIGAWPADRVGGIGPAATTVGLPHDPAGDPSWTARIDGPAWLLGGWGFAVAVQVAAIARQRRRLQRLLRRARPANEPALLALVAELSGRIELRRPPEVLIADDEGSPFVCRPRRPALVLPRGLAGALDTGPLRAVLLHELAHIRRRDLVWYWIPAIARVVYFFHPAAHYVAYRARLERELACDQTAMVLAGQEAAGYASTLVEVMGWVSAPPVRRPAMAVARLDGDAP